MRPFYLRFTSVLFFLLIGAAATYGQVKIGTNPQNIDLASILELESTSKVIVISRVNTVQMSAIVPLEGAMVYNTDAQCLHYYDGIEWINICEAFGNALTFTSNAVANPGNFETIKITQTDNNYNFEVGLLNASNIQDGTIDTPKIVNGAITLNKLATNSVNSTKIADKSIQTIDIAPGLPNTVLQTNNTGSNVLWAQLDASTITGRDLTDGDGSITVTNGLGATLVDSDLRVTDLGITTTKLADAAVENIKLGPDAVTTDKILDETILSEDIQDLTIATADLADGAVTTIKIVDANVTDLKLDKANISLTGFGIPTADLSIGTFKLIDVVDPTVAQDAATKNYVDTEINASNVLADANIFIGDASNIAQPLLVSGDATLANTGALTIANDAIITSKILDANVTDLKLDKANISLTGFGVPTADLSIGTFKLTDVADPTVAQDAATKNYVDTEINTSNVLADANIFIGDASNIAQPLLVSGDATLANTGTLTITDDAIITSKILDANVTDLKLDKANISLTGFGVPTADLSIGTFKLTNVVDPTLDQDAATKKYVDDMVTGSNTLTDANIFIGDGANLAQQLLISGDATLANTGALTIANDAITTLKIIDNAVTTDKIGTAGAIDANKILGTDITGDPLWLDKTTIAVSDFGAATADIDLGSNYITNVAMLPSSDPSSNPLDAANRAYVDGAVGSSMQTIVSGDAGNSITISGTDQGAFYDDSAVNTATTANATAITAKEDTLNKSTDVTLADGTNVKFPTELAVKTYVDNATADIATNTTTITTKENTANKSTDATLADGTNVKFPTELAVKTYVDNATTGIATNTTAITTKENTANKSTDVTLADGTNVKFPTELAVKTYVNNATTGIATNTTAITTKENTANKSTDVTLADGTNVKFPTELAVKTYVDNATTGIATNTTAITTKENTANKSTDVTLADGTNVKFPTELAVKTYVDTQITTSNNLADGSIFIGNGAGTAQSQTLSGDATITNTGVLTIGSEKVDSGKIANNTIVNADVNASAAIEGIKIDPDFGAQNITTTGTLGAGNTTISGTLAVTGQTTINTGANSTTLPTDRGTANQVLTTNGAGAATWQTPTANPLKAIGKIDGAGGVLKITSGVTPTRNSLGNYTVDLSSLSLPDANYIIQLTLLGAPYGSTIQVTNQTAASFTVQISAIQQTFNPSPPIGFTTGDPDLPNMNAVAAHTHSGLVDTFIIEGTSIDPIDAQWYFTVTDF